MHEKKGNKKYKYVLAEGDSNQPPSDLWLVSPLVEPTGQLQSKGAQKCNNVFTALHRSSCLSVSGYCIILSYVIFIACIAMVSSLIVRRWVRPQTL